MIGVGSALLSGLFTPLALARQPPLNVYTIIACDAKHAHMEISFDPAKRDKTLRERGLDFEDAPEVLLGRIYQWIDTRFEYGEERWITVGKLRGRMVVIVWTLRGEVRHIISMRKANEREQAYYEELLG